MDMESTTQLRLGRIATRTRSAAVQGRSEKRVFSAQTRLGKEREEREETGGRGGGIAKGPISITDVKVYP